MLKILGIDLDFFNLIKSLKIIIFLKSNKGVGPYKIPCNSP